MAKIKKVTYAKLHQAIHVPGICDFGSTLPPNKTFEKFDMTYDKDGVLLEVTFQRRTGKALVPWGNLAVVAFVEVDVPDEAKAPAAEENKKEPKPKVQVSKNSA